MFMIQTNAKQGPSKDCNTGATDSNIIIDSIVALELDTKPNQDRAAGKKPMLKRHGGKSEVQSRNGGQPFAVIQIERYNPSDACQKINNMHQLKLSHPQVFQR
jgi:hypothetical protein